MNERTLKSPWRRLAGWAAVVLAALVGSTLLSTLLMLQCAPTTARPATASATPPALAPDTATAVRAEMRNVDYHVDGDIVLHIRALRGSLVSTRAKDPPVFEDGNSYSMHIAAAEIAIDTADLSRLLNRYVFGYRGAPIRDLRVTVEGQELVQKGKLGNLSFTIHSHASVTEDGELRLHPTDVKVLGINADGLMKKLGIELDDMLKLRPDRGMRVDGNDFLLNVAAIIPPPHVVGKLTGIRLEEGRVVQLFGGGTRLPPREYFGGRAPAPNYMYYHGAIIRFGKLTMTGTDLLIVDADPSDPFRFYLQRYHDQLVAGSHRTTPEDGLVVQMPDLEDLKP